MSLAFDLYRSFIQDRICYIDRILFGAEAMELAISPAKRDANPTPPVGCAIATLTALTMPPILKQSTLDQLNGDIGWKVKDLVINVGFE
jgi:hypothetical protein